YNREVMALPGRLGDANSQGCNFLIESNRAHILSDVSSIAKLMSWNETESEKTAKPAVEDKGSELKGAEKKVYYAIKQAGETDVDTLLAKTSMPYNELSAALLNLELSDCVIAKPGKVYKAL
ncbi:MAG: hypothetical protein IJ250_02995, partial [Bacteroidales bacterium]|nr:hypothetical protein [Bacteroidales bacterium]